MKRRHFLWSLISSFALSAQEALPDWARPLILSKNLPDWPHLDAWRKHAGLAREGIAIELERYSDNGNSVPIKLRSLSLANNESIRAVHLITERNPRPIILSAEFLLPLPKLTLDTRIRLVGTQNIIAIAETTQGRTLWQSAHINVTDSACVEGA